MSKQLPEKYRPKTLDDVFGNDDTIQMLDVHLHRKAGPPTAMLLFGPRGCGKTTIAKIIKTELGIDDRDFFEYNTANARGIDTIREVQQNASYPPLVGKRKLYFFDECHKLTSDAQNAMLKLLETPPSDAVNFVLATTDPQLLLATLKSRCTKYPLAPLSRDEMAHCLKRVLKKEQVEFPDKVIKEIVRQVDGIPREGLILLDSMIGVKDDNALLKMAQNYSVAEKSTIDLCRALINGQRWEEVGQILQGIAKDDAESIRRQVLGYMTNALIGQTEEQDEKGRITVEYRAPKKNPRAAEIIDLFKDSFFYSGKSGLVLACYLACLGGAKQ